MQISFTSTYRIPLKPKSGSITPGKKELIKQLADKFKGEYPNNGTGNVRFSCKMKFDKFVKEELNKLNFKEGDYEVVPIHNVKNNQIPEALEYKGRFESLKN